eukprot:7520450-Karenia_brevis.AAC.1
MPEGPCQAHCEESPQGTRTRGIAVSVSLTCSRAKARNTHVDKQKALGLCSGPLRATKTITSAKRLSVAQSYPP